MTYNIHGVTIEADNKYDAMKFWRESLLCTDSVVHILNGQAINIYGNIYFSTDNWKTWKDTVYKSKKELNIIKNAYHERR